MKGKIYIIFLSTLFLLMSTMGYAQQKRMVSGQVIDQQKESVIGATVILKDTNVGAVTDVDGKFQIQVTGANPILQVSFLGMESQELAIGSKTNVTIEMTTHTEQLDEVVVIGYGAVRKRELTGAVEQVKGEDLTRQLTSDLSAALQGQVAGVSVTAASGAPGESSSILIRGISSVSGDNTPLYVVDGVPQDGDPRISSNEIETIDILKDAASCAIYGTRGSAGVILITTKQGTEGRMKVSVSSLYGFQTLGDGIELMDANETTYFQMVYARNLSGTYDSDVSLELNRKAIYYANDTDLRDAIFQCNYKTVSTQNHTVNLSGGSKTTKYNIVAGYYNQDGVLVNTGFSRFNTRANITYKQDKLTIGANLGITVENRAVGSPSVIGMSLRYSAQQELLEVGNTDPVYTDAGDYSNQLSWVAALLNTTDDRKTLRVSTNFNLGYDILPSLNLSSRIAYGPSYGYQEYFKPYQEIYNTAGELLSSSDNSTVTRTSTVSESLTWDATLTYNKKIKKHSLSLLAVVSSESYTNKGFSASKDGIINNDVNSFNSATINSEASSLFNWSTDNRNTLFGTLGRVLYNWDSRYMLSGSVRVDGSSKFSKDNRWGLFPSVSGAWNISDEKFWRKLKKTVSSAKIRASYGTTGNQNVTSYSYYNTISYGYDTIFGNSNSLTEVYGAVQDSFANSDLKWETTIQSNFGVDLSLFKNKITLSAEYYNTKKKDMIFDVPLPSSSGVDDSDGGEIAMNMGNMTNRGYEFSMRYRNSIKKLWYMFGATFSTNENVITYMPSVSTYTLTSNYGLMGDTVTALAQGYEAGAFFLYKTDGVVNTQEELADYQTLVPTAEMGDLVYIDSNNDGQINEEDRVYCGSGLPKYEIGLTLNATYRNFDFYMQWYSALGHEIMNGAKMVTYAYATNKDLVSQWSEVNPESNIPAYRGNQSEDENYRGYTDLWLEDGSYLRLKNITLGYTIPMKIVSKWGLSKLRFYVSVQNLFTLTSYTGYNPEVGGSVISRGVDSANYPASVTYTGGLNLNF
ncbi:MAG: TonB-dependent receptor [Rikenellaceae bacterium]